MSYFQYTARDVAAARLSGHEEARIELSMALAALYRDTDKKLNAEEAYDRSYLFEDLLMRIGQISDSLCPEVTDLFDELKGITAKRPAYPILHLHAFETTEGSSGMVCTALIPDENGHGKDCGKPAVDFLHI